MNNLPLSHNKLIGSIILLLINLSPLVGVLFFNWSAFSLLWFYCAENVLSGIANVPLMLIARGKFGRKLLLTVVFCLHFGIFCFAHIMVLSAFLNTPLRAPLDLWQLLQRLDLTNAVYLTLAWYLIGNLKDWLLGEVASSDAAMLRPYKRMAVLHISLILGAVLMQFIAADWAILILCISLKFAGDIYWLTK